MSKIKSVKYYQNNKGKLQRSACERSPSKEQKKQQYGRERYKNLLEDDKQKLVEKRKKYHKMRKSVLL